MQTAEMQMQEYISAASVSPHLESPDPVRNAIVEPRGPRIKFKPLKPPSSPDGSAEVEASDLESAGDENAAPEPDKLSDADDAPAPEDMVPVIKASTPPPEPHAVEATMSPAPSGLSDASRSTTQEREARMLNANHGTTAPANPPAGPRPGSTEPTPALRHEAETHYERRTTRSETRVPERTGAGSRYRGDELDAQPAAAVKQEEDTASAVPVAGGSIELRASSAERKGRYAATKRRRPSQTRGPKTRASSSSTRAKATLGLNPAPSTRTRELPTPTRHVASAVTRELGPDTASSRAGAQAALGLNPAPSTRTRELPTPTRHVASPIARKLGPDTASLCGTGRVPDTKRGGAARVLGKRKTRGWSGVQEEIGKAGEGSVARRTRSKG